MGGLAFVEMYLKFAIQKQGKFEERLYLQIMKLGCISFKRSFGLFNSHISTFNTI